MSSELDIQTAILKYLKAQGAYAINIHGNEYMENGTPDILAVYQGRAYAFEVKRPKDWRSITEPQVQRLTQHYQAGGISLLVTGVEAVAEIIGESPYAASYPRQRSKEQIIMLRRMLEMPVAQLNEP